MKSDKNLKISAIVPVYNNEKTVSRVLAVLLRSKYIDQVIAVNDGSRDYSLSKLKSLKNKKLKLLNLLKNHGKGAAIEKAISLVKNPVIIIVDADLYKLKRSHINSLVMSFYKSQADMVIAARREDGGFQSIKFNPIDALSGERIFYKKNIEPVRHLLKKVNNGFEQVVNFAHKDKKVKMVYSQDIGHVLRLKRYKGKDVYKIPVSYAKEGWDLCKTALLIQLFSLSLLR
ncbi:glycosyltransferase family 2 protein [Patescibacteria group bacterium]